jgi:hypothetical protein
MAFPSFDHMIDCHGEGLSGALLQLAPHWLRDRTREATLGETRHLAKGNFY